MHSFICLYYCPNITIQYINLINNSCYSFIYHSQEKFIRLTMINCNFISNHFNCFQNFTEVYLYQCNLDINYNQLTPIQFYSNCIFLINTIIKINWINICNNFQFYSLPKLKFKKISLLLLFNNFFIFY